MTTVAIPAAPVAAVTVTPLEPLKSSVDILPAVPTAVPLSFLTVRPPIAPVPTAVSPVNAEPSPLKAAAVTIPAISAPACATI